MLVATRDHEPHAHAVHFGPATPRRSLAAHFTGAVQLVGSLVGIPLALIGGYSTYHATFSPEGKCQALRANIVSMLDKKTDATTLRLLVQRDVVTFERECGAVDADAAAAFKTLLASDKAPAVAHRVATPTKIEKVEKVEAVVAQPPAKFEKTEKVEKREPVKRDIVKREMPAKETAAKEAVAKLEAPKQLGAPPHPLVAPAPEAEKIVETPKPAETVAVAPGKANVDATWVASVREVLRESASQPAAETTPDIAADKVAAPLPSPINISPEAQLAHPQAKPDALVPPADIGPAQAPRPPAPIPNAN
jgi:hypothetical protein